MTSMKEWFLYVLRCSDDSLYTGITTDLERRLYEHNNSKLGAKYTKNKRPVHMLYNTSFPNRSDASKAEWRFKRLSKVQKEAVISGKKNAPWSNPSDEG